MGESVRSGENDAQLLARIASGSQDALRSLYDRYSRDIFLYSLSMTRDPHDAEDVAQDTWLALWAARKRVDMKTQTLLPWLLVTARHKSLTTIAKTAKRAAHAATGTHADDVGAAVDTTLAVEGRDIARYIAAVVARLPAIDQQIYQLCIVDDMSYADASESLGVSNGVVRNRLSRLRFRLRAHLEGTGQSS